MYGKKSINRAGMGIDRVNSEPEKVKAQLFETVRNVCENVV